MTQFKTLTLSGLLIVLSSFMQPVAAEVDTAVEDTAYYLCGGCHGPENIHVEHFDYTTPPNIIGQKKGYLAKQMKAYRDRKRIHPDMNGVLEPFSDKNIDDLANYYANTSAYLPGSSEIPADQSSSLAAKPKTKN